MKFEIRHLFSAISLEDYEQLYFDEPFNIELCRAVELDRELVSRELNRDKLTREVRISPRGRTIPAPVAKALGGSRIEYVEKIDYRFGTFEGHWESISSLMTDRISSTGTFRFEAVSTGIYRVIVGEVRVRVLGLGKVIEKAIVDDVKRSYIDAARFTEQWIAARSSS